MIDRLLILIFFCIFLFVPLVKNFDFESNHTKKPIFSNKTSKFLFHNAFQSYNSNNIVDAIDKVSQSVVGISVITINDNRPTFEVKNGIFIPYTKDKEVKTLGSGLIYSNSGYVITNTHVIKDADKIFVTLTGGEKFEAELVGSDDLTDLALLKVNSSQLLPVSNLGNSDNLKIGEWVIALGNPLGLFDLSYQPTATIGIISGLNIDFGLQENSYVYKDMIQTDASINEGNSGGPLINIFGEVIGINTFIMTGSNVKKGSIGLAFSIPIHRVKDIIHELIIYGEVKRTYSTGFKIKPMKDPAKPKRPTSAYLYFCEAARPKLMKKMKGKKNKKVNLGDIAKQLGAMWKGLSENDKKPYVEKSLVDKERYLDEMEKYNANK